MAEKVTIMVLKVDLQCSCCYKKVKKLLCKFPQNKLSLSCLLSCDTYSGTREIRDQVYDEKQNTVTITVVCCSPEKIRDKLCCKGGKVIKSIEIRSPPKPKEPEKPKLADKPKEPEKPKLADKPKDPEKPKPPVEKPKPPAEKPKEPVKPKEAEKHKEPVKPKEAEKPKELEKPKAPAEKPTPPKAAPPIVPAAPKAPQLPATPTITGHGCPSIFPYEPACCGPCSQGRPGGPCYHGYGRPGPNNCYDNNNYGYNNHYDNNNNNNGAYGGAYNDFNGGGRPCYARPCDYYPIGDNTSSSACTIM